VVGSYESLVNCGVRLDPFIVSYTGITQRMVDSAPPPHKVLWELLEFLGTDAIVAHNATFDSRFLASELARASLDIPIDPFICSLKLSRRLLPGLPSYRLSEVASHLGLSHSGAAHRAGSDARLTADLLLSLVARIRMRCKEMVINAKLLRQVMTRQI
jgi:DNA polymerase-3 subunit epsilon